MAKINVKDKDVAIISVENIDYISITDIAKYKTEDTNAVIANWMRNRNTIEFLGIWEGLYNNNFKPLEFEGFRKEAGLNAFTMSPQKWINATNAIGFIVKSGRYGGTFAHKDIALKFASWVSIEFELYLLKEFQRLKEDEQKQIGWTAKRELAKIRLTRRMRVKAEELRSQHFDYRSVHRFKPQTSNLKLFENELLTKNKKNEKNKTFMG